MAGKIDLLEDCTLRLFSNEIDIAAFDCTDEDLNEFFKVDSLLFQTQLIGKSYAFTLDSSPRNILCAFTVSNDALRVIDLPNARKRKAKKDIPHAKSFPSYPAVKVGRLGVDINYRKKGFGLGSQMMNFIKGWFADPENKTGCRFITVDAYNNEEALEYYKRNSFVFLFPNEVDEVEYVNKDRDAHHQLKPEDLKTRTMHFDLMGLLTS